MKSSGNKECVVLYSGGTDSTCAASLMSEKFSRIHLLTFYQYGLRKVPHPINNVDALRRKFPDVEFIQKFIAIDKLVKYISYNRYLKYLVAYRWLILATPGYTSLGWHVRSIVYCLENNIYHVFDGLTKELMHFPEHLDSVIDVFRQLYALFGIEYANPVRDWAVPPDQQFIDRLIVDQHGFFFPSELPLAERERTTGQYLYELGILPAPNVKGSALDYHMQYECYPFIIYNMMVFWIYLNFRSYDYFCKRIHSLFKDKECDIRSLLTEYRKDRINSVLSKYIE